MSRHERTEANEAHPRGYVPSHLAAPALRGRTDHPDNSYRATIHAYMAERAGEVRLAADLLAGPGSEAVSPELHQELLEGIADEARGLQRLALALKAGLLGVMALAVVGAVLVSPAGTGSAQAATAMAHPWKTKASASIEGPEPDPVAAVSAPATVRVTLGAAPVAVWVRATVYTEKAPGWFCASVWTAQGRVGGTCSIGRTFPIPVAINPRTFPVGRTFAQVVDDATNVAVSNVTFDARRPSRFGVGYFEDRGRGDLAVRVPVFLYSPAASRWVPQVQSPVQVQERVGGAWRVRATLTTNPPGLAVGVVHLGGGVHTIRVVRPAGRTVWATTGRVHVFNLLTEPVDII
jgi:hypothetical protein